MAGKIKNYTARVYLELDVQAKGKREVREAIKEINWEKDIWYRCPRSGFLTDWRIQARGETVDVVEVEEE